jgi:hypothetical protein
MTKVHKYKNVWWFWDETKKPRKRIGSYTSRAGAEKGLEDWIDSFKENNKEKYNEQVINELSEIPESSDDCELKCQCA